MKTLADIKRRIQIGTILDMKHLQSVWAPGPRKVIHTDSVKFGIETIKANGEVVTSYCDWPRAKDVKITGPNTFVIYSDWYNRIAQREEYMPLLEYTFIEDIKP